MNKDHQNLWGEIRSVAAQRSGYKTLWPLIEHCHINVEDVGRYLWDTVPWDTSDTQRRLSQSLNRYIINQKEHAHPRLIQLQETFKQVIDERFRRCHEIAKRTGKLQQVFYYNGIRPFGSRIVFREHIKPSQFDLIWCEIEDCPYALYQYSYAVAVGESGLVINLDYASITRRTPYWGTRLCLEAQPEPTFEMTESEIYDLLLCDLGLSHEDIHPDYTVIPPFAKWQLMRQDDNAHTFQVAEFDSRSAALLAFKQLKPHHFKQSYWIEKCSP